MNSHVFASLVEATIPFLGGLYCTALGYRWVGKRPGESPDYDAWYQKHGSKLKALGPCVAVFGIILFLVNLSRPPA